MKVEDIIALAKAGFSMEQIGEINKVMNDPQPGPTPALHPEPTQAPTPQPEPTPAPQPQDDPILQELLGIKTLIQKQNILHDVHGGQDERTTDDILASLISPPRKEGGK